MMETGTDSPTPEVLAQLRARYPDSPFLALGQSVFWDEPVKAVLRKRLDDLGLGGTMVLGVHDTDYFAKSRQRRSGTRRFALLPHNDGTTRDLWSAAGEISTLFGSETFPRREDFARYGVAFNKASQASELERQEFIDSVTEAWGWRGLVYTGSSDLIVNRLPLRDVGDGILEALTWGFENALAQIVPGCCQEEARAVAERILQWCRDYREQHPDRFLTDLFQYALPRLFQLLLGHEPANTTVTSTSKLLRFTPETASLPRFRFVNLFLDPSTRAQAVSAYNQALEGSEIYTLDRFGAGALPFDVVLPVQGRGTLRVTPRVVFIETRQPIAIGLKKPVESVQELAELLHRRLGEDVVLVGKAVALVSMLAQEFIFVFNEEGSLYVRRTRQMNDALAAQGIALDMRPILRLRYQTWDSLAVGRSTLRPAEHLAAVFGQATITTPEFAANWQQVLVEQRAVCEQMSRLRKPSELLASLRELQPGEHWDARALAYEEASKTLRHLRELAVTVQADIHRLYAERRLLNLRADQVQKAKGVHCRQVDHWSDEETECRVAFDAELAEIAHRKRSLDRELRGLKQRRLEIERGPEAREARRLRAVTEAEAELARLYIVRNALLALEGLPHTNHRPSAWWLPLVDPSGHWFHRIAETTEAYLEPLQTA